MLRNRLRNLSALPVFARSRRRRSNLGEVVEMEIATHLSGARNDKQRCIAFAATWVNEIR
jgi:hypothetical protein